MPNIDVPQFAYPFALNGRGKPKVREQDSDDNIVDCIEVLLSTERGERIDEPTYGIADPAFTEGGANLDSIASAIDQWEDRLPVDIEDNGFIDMVQHVGIRIQGRE